jgi:hypothetical protein
MAASQSTVKEQVSKNLEKIKGKIRTLKNAINKPRNDYPEIGEGQTFVIANGESVVLKLTKKDGNIVISESIEPASIKAKIINLFTGLSIFDDTENTDDIKLYQILDDGKELCRVTVGGGLVANIKKPDLSVELDTWIEL